MLCLLSRIGTEMSVFVLCDGQISLHIQHRMKDLLTEFYGVDTRTNVENRRITDSWDAMQRQV